jgi:hypothetical protein
LLIEGYSSNEGDFVVDVTCQDPPGVEVKTLACGETVQGTTVGAGSQYGNQAGDAAFTFVAGTSVVSFDACESDYDSYLRLYDAGGAEVATNDDHDGVCGGTNYYASHLQVEGLAVGATYTLVVEGYSSDEGGYIVTATCHEPPSSENLGELCGESLSGSTVGATSFYGNSAGEMVYTFTAAQSTYLFDGCGSTYDSYLRVYNAEGTEVAGNDDYAHGTCSGSNRYASHLETSVLTAGATYSLVVEGYSSNEGDFFVHVSCPSSSEAKQTQQSMAAFALSKNPVVTGFAIIGFLAFSTFMLQTFRRQKDYAVVLDHTEI